MTNETFFIQWASFFDTVVRVDELVNRQRDELSQLQSSTALVNRLSSMRVAPDRRDELVAIHTQRASELSDTILERHGYIEKMLSRIVQDAGVLAELEYLG